MKVGDMVIFRNCALEGDVGIITRLTEPSHIAQKNAKFRLYWVLCDRGIECFTGDQLTLV
jgi:hypothetical protein